MKLRISKKQKSLLRISRRKLNESQMVYIACADRAIKYKNGRSRILYIGTTKDGIHRVAKSAADHAKEFFSIHGVKKVYIYPITVSRRRNLRTWKLLEVALLMMFKTIFEQVPFCNMHGKNYKWGVMREHFNIHQLEQVINAHSADQRSRKRKNSNSRKGPQR